MVVLTITNTNSTDNDFVVVRPRAPGNMPSSFPSSVPSMIPGVRAAISGIVFEDLDNDDVGDTALAGVVVSLSDNNGSTLRTTLTDSSGTYLFINVLAGSYSVIETNLPGFVDVSPNNLSVVVSAGQFSVGNDFIDERSIDASSSSPSLLPFISSAPFVSSKPSFSPSLSFSPSVPLSKRGIIGGSILEDIDNDNDGDVGIIDVLISLFDDSGRFVASTLSDSNGNYIFRSVVAGTYTVQQTNLAGFVDVTGSIRMVVVIEGGFSSSIVFIDERVSLSPSISVSPSGLSLNLSNTPSIAPTGSLITVGSISGFVLEDTDFDGVGEFGISGVVITLSSSSLSILSTTTTDSSGQYEFNDLPIGVYSVTETNLFGYVDVTDVDLINDNIIVVSLTFGKISSEGNNFIDSKPSSSPTISPSSSSAPSVAPQSLLGSVSGFVSEDADEDGVGELALQGVLVNLVDSLTRVVGSTLTDSAGFYTFVDVPIGTYTIFETNLPGYTDVFDIDGVNDGQILSSLTLNNLNSTFNNFVDRKEGTSLSPFSTLPSSSPSTVRSPSHSLMPSSEFPIGLISGNVTSDTDNDGIGDIPLRAVTVALFNESNIFIVATLTASDGSYRFIGVEPGRYTVVQSNLAGFSDVSSSILSVLISRPLPSVFDVNFVDQFSQGPRISSSPSVSRSPSTKPSSIEPSSISGSVSEDIDGDGIGDVPVGSVMIELFDLSSGTILTSLTASDGSFIFTVIPGQYILSETNLPGYVDVSPSMLRVTVTSGGSSTNNNFVDKQQTGTQRPTPVPLETLKPSKTPSSGLPFVCSNVETIDFDSDENGTTIPKGTYVSDQWLGKFGLNITAVSTIGGFTHGGRARIFNTSDPGLTQLEGDPDLGSPNRLCSIPGPGRGVGGRPGQPGENCVPQGNVLIVQESDKAAPDDNIGGGVLCFDFPDSANIVSIGLMDIPANRGDFVQVETSGNAPPQNIQFTGFGDNSVQRISVNTGDASKLCVFFVGEGAVTDITLCTGLAPSVVPSSVPSLSFVPTDTPSSPLVRNSSISGTVTEDADNDDDGDEPISGVIVTLTNSVGLSISTLTDSSGNYIFVSVQPGIYTVTQTNLPGYTDVTSNRLTVTVVAGGNSVGNNFVDEFASAAPSQSSKPSLVPVPSTCSVISVVDFDKFGNGTNSSGGDYVKNEWLESNGFSIDALSTCGGFTPNGMARIFNTSSPGLTQKEGDPDLGSPNQMCAFTGPGQGIGGQPGQPGENCVPQGNVLIIQESNKTSPDDNNEGGILCFDFVKPAEVFWIGLMGIVERGDFIEVDFANSMIPTKIHFNGLGKNAIQRVSLNLQEVTKLCLYACGEAAVTEIAICNNTTPVTSEITGRVTEDVDNDGTGDLPLSGVIITLRNSDGLVLGTTITDSDGNYVFTGLRADTYSITQTNLDGFLDVSSNLLTATVSDSGVSSNNSFIDKRTSGIPLSTISSRPTPSGLPSISQEPSHDPSLSSSPSFGPSAQPSMSEIGMLMQRNCTVNRFPCQEDSNKLSVCVFNQDTDQWGSMCIDEDRFSNLQRVFPAYCGACSSNIINFAPFLPSTPVLVEETDGNTLETCSSGKFGSENVEIISSDGSEVNFTLKHSFCPSVDRLQVWYDDAVVPGFSNCHGYGVSGCNSTIDAFSVKCVAGWANVSLIAEKGDDFTQRKDVPTPRCQRGFDFTDFNPLKRCHWVLSVPCQVTESKRRLSNGSGQAQSVAVTVNEQAHPHTLKPSMIDILPVSVDSCNLAAAATDGPITILSQNTDSIKFELRQPWKGCMNSHHNLKWIAIDYVGLDDDLHCSKFTDVGCGLTSILDAKCNDGATVIDLYVSDSDPNLFRQTDGTSVAVPDVCGVSGDLKHTCHYRYILKCEPSQFTNAHELSRRLRSN